MRKSDHSIRNICVAKIKRSTIKPYDFKWTKFYESNADFPYSGLALNLSADELIICSTVIDGENFSILTTRRLLTKREGELHEGEIQGAADKFYGDFKGYKNKIVTFGRIQLHEGRELMYFIETGRASMIMVQGVRTLLSTSQMTSHQVEKVTRIWNRKNGE